VNKNGSTSRNLETGWVDMWGYMAMMNLTNCMDIWMRAKSKWDNAQIVWIYETSPRLQESKSWDSSTVYFI
jgi:hypothetical protein